MMSFFSFSCRILAAVLIIKPEIQSWQTASLDSNIMIIWWYTMMLWKSLLPGCQKTTTNNRVVEWHGVSHEWLSERLGRMSASLPHRITPRALFQYPIRRLIVRSRKVSNPWDLYLELSDRSEIWQISKRYDDSNYQSRSWETSWDLTIKRPFGYWNSALR